MWRKFLLLSISCLTVTGWAVELGVVYHLGNPHVRKNEHRIRQDLQVLAPLGHRIRDAVYWTDLEPASGRFVAKQRLEALPQSSVLGLFAYSNPLYSQGKFQFSLSTLPPMRRALKRALQQYPEILEWEILNEPNLQKYFQAQNPIRLYQKILIYLSSLIRNKNRRVVAGSILLEGDFRPWLKMLFESSRYFDVLSLHVYTWPHSVRESVIQGRSLDEWLGWIRRHYQGELILSETGWPVSRKSSRSNVLSPKEALSRLRELCTISRRHGVSRVYIYALEDDGPSGSQNPFDHFGLQNQAGEDKFSYESLEGLKRSCATR